MDTARRLHGRFTLVSSLLRTKWQIDDPANFRQNGLEMMGFFSINATADGEDPIWERICRLSCFLR